MSRALHIGDPCPLYPTRSETLTMHRSSTVRAAAAAPAAPDADALVEAIKAAVLAYDLTAATPVGELIAAIQGKPAPEEVAAARNLTAREIAHCRAKGVPLSKYVTAKASIRRTK